jgi:hypothetical protein
MAQQAPGNTGSEPQRDLTDPAPVVRLRLELVAA